MIVTNTIVLMTVDHLMTKGKHIVVDRHGD